jgi:hypothetical protein
MILEVFMEDMRLAVAWKELERRIAGRKSDEIERFAP